MDRIITFGIIAVVAVIVLAIIGLIVTRLYKRAPRQEALIRTGQGGLKVVKDGGTLVVPVLHEMSKVNLATQSIQVINTGEDALMTSDDIRADMVMTFFIRVSDDPQMIGLAAQTLGDKTYNAADLTSLIAPKVSDAARAAAVGMTLRELQTNRTGFVQKVTQQLTRDLETNGLVLDNVSLTKLDQANYKNLDPNNVFNATGMTVITRTVTEQSEARSKREAENRTRLAEDKRNADARELELKAQLAEDQAKANAREMAAKAHEEAEIAKAREDSARLVEIARQDRAIAVAQKSREESEANAEANKARAIAIQAEESVKTAAEIAEANRKKDIEVIQAQAVAERDATGITVKAASERAAAEDRAAAVRAEAEAEAARITTLAEARKAEGLAEAEARTAIVAAENSISTEQRNFNLDLARVNALPKVVENLMKPAEKIGSIRMIHGLGGIGGGTGDASGATASPANLQDAILGVALHGPAVKKVGEMLGVELGDGMSGVLDYGMAERAEDVPGEPAPVVRSPRPARVRNTPPAE